MIADILDYPTKVDAAFLRRVITQLTANSSTISEERCVLLLRYFGEYSIAAVLEALKNEGDERDADEEEGKQSNCGNPVSENYFVQKFAVDASMAVLQVIGVYHGSPWTSVKTCAATIATELAISITSHIVEAENALAAATAGNDGEEEEGGAPPASSSSSNSEVSALEVMDKLPWIQEVLGLLKAHLSTEIQRISHLTILPHEGMNEISIHCLKELELFAPGFLRKYCWEDMLRLRKGWMEANDVMKATHQGTATHHHQNPMTSSMRSTSSADSGVTLGDTSVGPLCSSIAALDALCCAHQVASSSECGTGLLFSDGRTGCQKGQGYGFGVQRPATPAIANKNKTKELQQECAQVMVSAVDCMNNFIGSYPVSLAAETTLLCCAGYGFEQVEKVFYKRNLRGKMEALMACDVLPDEESTVVCALDHFAALHLKLLVDYTVMGSELPPLFIPHKTPPCKKHQQHRGGESEDGSGNGGASSHHDILQDQKHHYFFSTGPQGLGYYRKEVSEELLQNAAALALRAQLCFVDSLLFHSKDRQVLFALTASQSQALGANALERLEKPHRIWESPTSMYQRVIYAASSGRRGIQSALSTLRSLKDSSSCSMYPTMRSAISLCVAALASYLPQARAPCATLLSSFTPEAIHACVAVMYFTQKKRNTAASRKASTEKKRPGGGETTQRIRRLLSGWKTSPSNRDEEADERDGDPVPAHAQLLGLVGFTIVINHTAQQLVRNLPTLYRVLSDPDVNNKMDVIAHFSARIPEVDNSWYVGNALIMCLRMFLVREIEKLTESSNHNHSATSDSKAVALAGGSSSSKTMLASATKGFLSAMMKHFSDAAIAVHLKLFHSTLQHLPLETLAYLLDMNARDAEDVMKFCERKGGAQIPVLPEVPIDILLQPLPPPYYLQEVPKALSLTELTFDIQISLVIDEEEEESAARRETATSGVTAVAGGGSEDALVGALLKVYTDGSDRDEEHLVLSQPVPILNTNFPTVLVPLHLKIDSYEPPALYVSCFIPQHQPMHYPDPLSITFERYIRHSPRQELIVVEDCAHYYDQRNSLSSASLRLLPEAHLTKLKQRFFKFREVPKVTDTDVARAENESKNAAAALTKGASPGGRRAAAAAGRRKGPSYSEFLESLSEVEGFSIFDIAPDGRVLVELVRDSEDCLEKPVVGGCDGTVEDNEGGGGGGFAGEVYLAVRASSWRIASLFNAFLTDLLAFDAAAERAGGAK